MKRALVVASLLAIAVCASGQGVDLSTPEATIRSFLATVNAGEFSKATACVENARPSKLLDTLAKSFVDAKARITISALTVSINGSSATAAVKTSATESNPPKGNPMESSETVSLRLTAGQWRILPFPASEARTRMGSSKPEFIGILATIVASPESVGQPPAPASVSCLSNVKQLCLACLMYAQDNNERYPRLEGFTKAIMPYVKNSTIFVCPDRKSPHQGYALNPSLSGARIARISRPAETVLLYEGASGKPVFPHSGKTTVGFADGHCAMMTPAQVRGLRWKP